MSVLIEKAIVLNLAVDISEELQGIFDDMGIKVINREDHEDQEFNFILVRDYIGSYHELLQKLEIEDRDVPIISLSPVENKSDFISANGKGWINEELLKNPIAVTLVQRLFGQNSSLQLEYVLGEKVNSLRSCKLSGHMSVGHYTDLVACEALENNFDIVSIRNFFVGVVSYLTYLNRGEIASFPFEVNFGAGDDAFTIQIYADVKNFVIEYLFESFSSVGGNHPFKYLLDMSTRLANLFDVYYLENASKIVMTGVWFREDFISSENYFSTMQIHEIERFSRLQERWSSYVGRPEVALEQTQTEIVRKLERYNLPGDYAELLVVGKGNYLSKYPVILKQIVEFVQSVRAGEEFPKPLETLVPDDVLQYLCTHPNTEMVQKLENADLEVIVKGLLRPELLDSIDEAISYFQEEARSDEKYRDPFFDSIYDTISHLDLDLVNQMIGDSAENKSDAQRILGKYGVDNDVFMVRGTGDSIDEDFWRTKGGESFAEIKGIFDDLDELDELEPVKAEEVVIKSVTEHLNFDPSRAEYFTEELFSQAKATVDDLDEESDDYGKELCNSLATIMSEMDYEHANSIMSDYSPEEPTLEINSEFWDAYEDEFLKELDAKVGEFEDRDDGLFTIQDELTHLVAAGLNFSEGKASYTVHQIMDDVKAQMGDIPVDDPGYKKEFFKKLKGNIGAIDEKYVVNIGEKYSDDVQVVKGVYGNVTSDYWKVKGMPLVDSMKTVVRKLKEGGKTIDELEGEIFNTLDMNLDMEENKLKLFVKSIMANAASAIAGGEFQENIDELMGDLSKNFDELGWQNEVMKRNEQIARMKNLIDKMKVEIMAGREVENAVNEELQKEYEDGETLDYAGMKERQARAENDTETDDGSGMTIVRGGVSGMSPHNEAQWALKLKAAETALKKAKKDVLKKADDINRQDQRYKDQMKRQQEKITLLEKKVNELVSNKQTNSEEVAYKDQIMKLQLENKSLNSMVEVANKRIANVSANANRSQTDVLKKSKFEMDRIRENYNETVEKMSKFKLENQQLTAKVKALDNSLRALQNKADREREIGEKRTDQVQDGLAEKNKEVMKLKHNLGMAANEKKALEFKVSELQAKVKAMMSQPLVAAGKEGGAQAAKAGKSENESKLELKLKQMEHVNDKLATQTNKLASDLATAKKEVVKFKAEAMTLKNKNQELERRAKNR